MESLTHFIAVWVYTGGKETIRYSLSDFTVREGISLKRFLLQYDEELHCGAYIQCFQGLIFIEYRQPFSPVLRR